MYFCPCSCTDPLDPEAEEHALVSLPRNLSYAQESYLDLYSTSAHFVHNPKLERKFQYEQNLDREANVEAEQQRLLEAVLRARDYTFRNSQALNRTCVVSNSSTQSEACYSGGSGGGASFKNNFVFHRPGCVHVQAGGGSVLVSGRDTRQSSDPSTEGQQQPKSPLPTEIEVECPPTYLPPPTTEQTKGAGSLLGPAARVASRLSALLQSPPNESMDDHRGGDIGSSVDGDELPSAAISPEGVSVGPCLVTNPDHLHQQIDRGLDIRAHQNGDVSEQIVHDKDESLPTLPVCESVDFHESDMDPSDCDDVPNEPEIPDLFPKPFGGGGKTYFPRSDISVSSSSDQEDVTTDVEEETIVEISDKKTSEESPDSDGFSEEGVFVNMDDLDSTHDRSNTVSEVSDDTCISEDSVILSPAEGELLEEEEKARPVRKMSLEEAISRAAIDLNKMTMYEERNLSSLEGSTTTLEGEDERDKSRTASAALGRDSPVRTPTGLKISITSTDNTDGAARQTQRQPYRLSDSPVYDDEEFNFSRTTLRKSSSLKTNKTPPTTPHRKKAVRFADAMGLDLESVRTVLNTESPPRIPASAMADLRAGLEDDRKDMGTRYLCSCFSQPGAEAGFHQRVMSQKVCLENAIITDLTITGVIRVANVAFHKSARIRYTHNRWATFHDIAATYCLNSCDGPTDRFSFSIVAPADFSPGRRLEFAISYNAGSEEFWDSNDGNNYAFECFAKTVPMESETAWLHFI